jgi:hypothetical protein
VVCAQAAYVLREETGVDAVEMFDPACLRECKANDAMVKLVHGLSGCDQEATSLLIECRGKEETMLNSNIDEVLNCLKKYVVVLSLPPPRPSPVKSPRCPSQTRLLTPNASPPETKQEQDSDSGRQRGQVPVQQGRGGVQAVLGRAQGAHPHRGRGARGGDLHVDRGRRMPRGTPSACPPNPPPGWPVASLLTHTLWFG